jgi:hypothetical protein
MTAIKIRREQGAALLVDRGAFDEDLGQSLSLGPRPGGKRADELLLVDQTTTPPPKTPPAASPPA